MILYGIDYCSLGRCGLGSFLFVNEIELAVFFSVGIAESGLFVGEVDFSALDIGGLDDGCGFEDVAIGDDEGGLLAGFE